MNDGRIDGTINGAAGVFGVMGDPVSRSFSPQIHNTIYGMFGINAVYVPFPVKGESLGKAVAGAHALGVRGINVTHPHKREVMEYLRGVDGKAERIGAVNTLVYAEEGYIGYNTDAIGVADCCAARGFDAGGRKVTIIGAGGSAAAAAFALAEGGAGEIRVLNRTLSSAEDLAERLQNHFGTKAMAYPLDEKGILAAMDGADAVFQTTAAGFGGGESPVKAAGGGIFKGIEFVMETIYSPWETEFLRDARIHCRNCMNGFDMLVYQAAAAHDLFMGTNRFADIGEKIKLRDTLEGYYINNIIKQGEALCTR